MPRRNRVYGDISSYRDMYLHTQPILQKHIDTYVKANYVHTLVYNNRYCLQFIIQDIGETYQLKVEPGVLKYIMLLNNYVPKDINEDNWIFKIDLWI